MSAIKPAAGIHLSGLGNRFLLAVQQNLIAVRSIPRSILTNGLEVQILKIHRWVHQRDVSLVLLLFFITPLPFTPRLCLFSLELAEKSPHQRKRGSRIDSQVKREKTHTHTINRLILKAEIDCSSADRSKALQSHGNAQSSLLFPELPGKGFNGGTCCGWENAGKELTLY